MTQTCIIYARYSTDRQDEVSLETQIELCEAYAQQNGITVLEVFTDTALSGQMLKRRPGIQAALKRSEAGDVDIFLCITTDRLSRDGEHTSGIKKTLKFYGTEIHTAREGRVTNLELSLRAILSEELIEQIRYRTREGMRMATRKGKVAGGLSYGYRVKLEYDANGHHVPGKREIVEEEAATIRWIYEEYAKGQSPQKLATQLNRRSVSGPRGKRWRDTAIRGHVGRGTGILNNEMYRGRIVFGRRQYITNPMTERRTARDNTPDQWTVSEVPDLRIVDESLWERVKRRQLQNAELYPHTQTNKLNKSHRPRYLLSGLLECGCCGGPFAVSGKDRYSCTNRGKKLPIEHLGDAVCPNGQGITRQSLEERVLAAFPESLFSLVKIKELQGALNKVLEAQAHNCGREADRLRADLTRAEQQQQGALEMVLDRKIAGQQPLPALDQKIEKLETLRLELQAQLDALPMDAGESRRQTINLSPSMLRSAIAAICKAAADDTAGSREDDIHLVRQLVQKVVIHPSGIRGHPDLDVFGRLASILAALEAWAAEEKRLKLGAKEEFNRKRADETFRNAADRIAWSRRFHEELDRKRREWIEVQVSVVAGAGFEPATFRL